MSNIVVETGMTMRVLGRIAVMALTASAATHSMPAWAGGVGDFLSPAFGTSCLNHHTGGHATGQTAHSTGSVDGNLLGLPVASPLNQCGGADAHASGAAMPSPGVIGGGRLVPLPPPLDVIPK